MKRSQALDRMIVDAKNLITKHLNSKRIDKGDHLFMSTHEVLGVIVEEFDELKEAIHLNDKQKIQNELLDLIIASTWGLISLRSKKMDW